MVNKVRLLECVLLVHSATNKSKLRPEQFSSAGMEVKKLKDFFQLETTETILLSSIIHLTLNDGETCLNELALYYGLEPLQFMPYLETIGRLSEQGLIEQDESDLYRRLLNTVVRPHPRTMEALLKGNADLIRPRHVNTIGSFFREYDRIILLRKNRTMGLSNFIKSTNKLCREAKQLPLINYLSRQKLSPIERNVVLNICLSTLCGAETSSIDAILKTFFDDMEDYYNWASQFQTKQSSLFTKSLLQKSQIFAGSEVEVMLMDTITQFLLPEQTHYSSKIKTEMTSVIEPESLTPINLYYSSKVGAEIQLIKESLKDRNFKALQNKLVANKLKRGITILLHGAPGTGKTETAYQLAHALKRTILMVDISKIKSMWVGESEKHIRKVFEEYRAATKVVKKMPILLFNEADAILGRRRMVNTGIDSMDNALQNILLQELEDFEGIFMATTNQSQNLDTAFDRRFLFKIEFPIPDILIRKKILCDKLKSVNPKWLKTMSEKYILSGGQIENIKRKLVMQEMFSNTTPLTLSKLEELFIQETSQPMGTTARRNIGFKIN